MPNTPISPDLKGYRMVDYRDPVPGDSYNWSFTRTFSQIVKLAIHHTATATFLFKDLSPEEQANQIANFHITHNGWGGIGYHFLITPNGTVLYVGDILTGRANITNNNEKIIGICLVGDFTQENPTTAQIMVTHYLCEYFMNDYPQLTKINTWDDVIGHKDAVKLWSNADPTACPGTNWKGVADSIYNRIKGGIGYDPLPQPVPGPIPPEDGSASSGLQAEIQRLNDRIGQLDIQVGEFDAKMGQIRAILYGKGWPWTKINNLKKIVNP